MMRLFSRGFHYWRQHGLLRLLRRAVAVPQDAMVRKMRSGRDRATIRQILAANPGKRPIIFLPLLDWDCPLFQRPHHLALELAKSGYLYFFCAGNILTKMHGVKQVGESCYVTDRFDLLLEELPDAVLHVYSTDNNDRLSVLRSHLQAGRKILYEYIDEIHANLSGRPIPETTRERHAMLLANPQVCVAASADRLHDEVLAVRGSGHNVMFVPNAADVEHFAPRSRELSPCPEMQRFAGRGRPVIGYFGALASWFDYELVAKLATALPQCDIALIGFDYDGSLARLDRGSLPNVHVLGPVEYKKLPAYAAWFDVATIPFIINDITLSTSPIKLFEYMAMGLPVVTTAMPECRKEPLVLVAEDHADFIGKVEEAIALGRDQGYRKALRESVQGKHSWAARAADIKALLTAS